MVLHKLVSNSNTPVAGKTVCSLVEDIMKLIALSDTHGFHRNLTIPDGDVLIHAGDFSMRAKTKHVIEFADWFKSLPHKHKIVIAGNHDRACESLSRQWVKDTFFPAIYLDHEYHEIDGVTFFGSPYTSAIYDPSDWSFDYPRGGERGKRLWDMVHDGPRMDVLITHGPPYGILDMVSCPHVNEDPHVGDKDLLRAIEKHAPSAHIFGHIHEGYGIVSHGDTTFYNVSTCTEDYKATNSIPYIHI